MSLASFCMLDTHTNWSSLQAPRAYVHAWHASAPAGRRKLHCHVAHVASVPCADAGKCVEAGASTVVVAPYFLSRGRHIQVGV